MRNVPASRSNAVTLGNTSSSGPRGFQHLAPILKKIVSVLSGSSESVLYSRYINAIEWNFRKADSRTTGEFVAFGKTQIVYHDVHKRTRC